MFQALKNFSLGIMAAVELGKGEKKIPNSQHTSGSAHQGPGQEILKLGAARRAFVSVVMMQLELYLVI